MVRRTDVSSIKSENFEPFHRRSRSRKCVVLEKNKEKSLLKS